MHELGLAHLDIKPQNILFDKNFNIKIADFGTIEEDINGDGLTLWRKGTESYMAPELKDQHKKIEPYNMYKADIYSLGVTLYVMLTCELPSNFENEEIFTSSTHEYISNKYSKNSEYDKICIDEEKSIFGGVMNLIFQMINPDPSQRPT